MPNSAFALAGYAAPVYTAQFRNRIINGDFRIDQRGAGTTYTPNNSYTVDRWYAFNTQVSKFSLQQVSAGLAGFSRAFKATVTTPYSIASGDLFGIQQSIEGQNIVDFAFGYSTAKPIMLSFWVNASIAGNYGGALRNSGATRCYPFLYNIPVANTWTYISLNIAGDTTGTWNVDNTVGIQVCFSIGTGTTYSGTAGSWTTSNCLSATGATSILGTSGATFQITGVQLEQGTTATSFEYLPATVLVQLCQRYYCKSFSLEIAPIEGGGYAVGGVEGKGTEGSIEPRFNWLFPVEMRSAPTVTLYNTRSGGTTGQWGGGSGDSANARVLTTNTRLAVIDNSGVTVSTGQYFIGMSASADI